MVTDNSTWRKVVESYGHVAREGYLTTAPWQVLLKGEVNYQSFSTQEGAIRYAMSNRQD